MWHPCVRTIEQDEVSEYPWAMNDSLCWQCVYEASYCVFEQLEFSRD